MKVGFFQATRWNLVGKPRMMQQNGLMSGDDRLQRDHQRQLDSAVLTEFSCCVSIFTLCWRYHFGTSLKMRCKTVTCGFLRLR